MCGLVHTQKDLYIYKSNNTYIIKMAKKIYVCDSLTAKDIKYEYYEGCGEEVDNVQDMLDLMCEEIHENVNKDDEDVLTQKE